VAAFSTGCRSSWTQPLTGCKQVQFLVSLLKLVLELVLGPGPVLEPEPALALGLVLVLSSYSLPKL